MASESDGWMLGPFTFIHFNMVEYVPLLNVGKILRVDAAHFVRIFYEFHLFGLNLSCDRN